MLLIVTDAAAYMLKAVRGLQTLYSKAMHLTCVHGMHRIAECIRQELPLIDCLVANGKKCLLKAPERVRLLHEADLELALPPEAIVTRWGTWLDAGFYYAENIERIRPIFDEFDPEDSVAVARVHAVLTKAQLTGQLAFLSANFRSLREAITRLESSQISLNEGLNLLTGVRESLTAGESRLSIRTR